MLRATNEFKEYILTVSRRGASDSVTDSPVLSNPADAQNVFCLYFQPSFVSIYINKFKFIIKKNRKC